MAWMERTPEKRADPRQVLPGCRSVISVGLNYLTDHHADERPGYGRIARYAWGKDYHKVLGDRLTQLEQTIRRLAPDAVTRSYTDTGPIMEKAWADRQTFQFGLSGTGFLVAAGGDFNYLGTGTR
jgi:epoxyqueuosine reductase